MKIVDVNKLLSEHPPATFLDTVEFNGQNFGVCDITGESPVWEMHPDTDEYFYVIEGRLELTLLTESEEQHYVATAGQSFVVSKGLWHKPSAPEGVKFIYFTPGQSLHSDAADPRIS